MMRLRLLPFLALAAGLAGCVRPVVTVEVLPPRTSVTCAAPAANAAAYGRGRFDVATTLGAHGSYLADLRLAVTGADVHVDGVAIAYDIPDGSAIDAADFDGEVLTGDAVLAGEDDERRVGVVENVELVSRELAVAFQLESNGIDEIEFATLGVTITPVVDEAIADAAATTFPLELCKGCLVTPPDVCDDEGEFSAVSGVCRPGQDIPAFVCNAAIVGGGA